MNKPLNNNLRREKDETFTSSSTNDRFNKTNSSDDNIKKSSQYSPTKISDADEKTLLTFKELYQQAVIESIEILGKQVSEVVINFLEEKHSIRLEETAYNPEVFHEVLEDAINGGSRIVERKIIKTLNKKLKISNNVNEIHSFNYADNISRLKRLYVESRINT